MLCSLCDEKANVRFKQHVGYQESSHYNILHCDHCNTAFVTPLTVDEKVYDQIYSQIKEMPGYERYLKYADKVLKKKKPLDYLATIEDTYWGIHQHLLTKNNKTKILEIGCGFGYLTYALKKAGYDVQGLDISQKAIEQARIRYGDNYIAADVIDYSYQNLEKYDVLILTEVIEHIPHVKEFLEALHRMLVPGGEILLTTPNKSFFPKDVLWETEPPPVHLWWFSEESMKFLANHLKCSIKFIELNHLNLDKHHRYALNFILEPQPFMSVKGFIPSRTARLDVNGKIIKEEIGLPPFKSLLHRFGLFAPLSLLKRKVIMTIFKRDKLKLVKHQGWPTMCVIFKKSEMVS